MRYLLFTICCLAGACGGPVVDQSVVSGAKAEDKDVSSGTTHTGQVTVEFRDDQNIAIAGDLVRIRPRPFQRVEKDGQANHYGVLEISISSSPQNGVAPGMSFMVVSREKGAERLQQLQLGMDSIGSTDYVGANGPLALSTACTDKLSAAFRYITVDMTNKLTAFERAITCPKNAVDDFVAAVPSAFANPDEHEIYLVPIPVDAPNAKVEAAKPYGYTVVVCNNGPCDGILRN